MMPVHSNTKIKKNIKSFLNHHGLVPESDVYKSIKIVRDDGEGAQIEFGYNVRQFKCKNGCEHHNHLVCVVCGKYIYMDDKALEEYQDRLAKENDFKPAKQFFRIYGTCIDCQ